MKKFWTMAALVCAVLMVSCSSAEDKATDFAKELKELSGTDKAKKIEGVVKARQKYENALSADKRKKYDAAWIVAVEKDAADIASEVVKAVKSCDVAKVQGLEKKTIDYKRGLYEHEIVAFDKAFNGRINDPKKGLKKEDMDKFNEAVYVWFHPLEKSVVIEAPVVEATTPPTTEVAAE